MTQPCSAEGEDSRNGRRANVFLAGVLHAAGGAFPVRIRNLSPEGALADGNDLPDEGNAVRLQRGPFTVAARVVWRGDKGCGLRFSAAIPVEQWINYGTASCGQQRVDAMIADARSGTAGPGPALQPCVPARIDCIQAATEMEAICEHLRGAAEDLASEPEFVVLAFDALQRLDIATAQLASLAQRLRTPGG